MNLSKNEDILMFKEKQRLFYVNTGDSPQEKKISSNEVRRNLKLEECFVIKHNGPCDFFIYLSQSDVDQILKT